ncbi:hypothetical protein B0T13DRAFT_37804 [Neurospora crassa]|nr:hypothetical protein B0T13DRAFT_37804 [Neurospora crassa]
MKARGSIRHGNHCSSCSLVCGGTLVLIRPMIYLLCTSNCWVQSLFPFACLVDIGSVVWSLVVPSFGPQLVLHLMFFFCAFRVGCNAINWGGQAGRLNSRRSHEMHFSSLLVRHFSLRKGWKSEFSAHGT